MATLSEIETTWNLNDLKKAIAVLDYADDLEYMASRRTNGNS